MSNFVLPRNGRSLRSVWLSLPAPYPLPGSQRLASVTSAINRGIRRSESARDRREGERAGGEARESRYVDTVKPRAPSSYKAEKHANHPDENPSRKLDEMARTPNFPTKNNPSSSSRNGRGRTQYATKSEELSANTRGRGNFPWGKETDKMDRSKYQPLEDGYRGPKRSFPSLEPVTRRRDMRNESGDDTSSGGLGTEARIRRGKKDIRPDRAPKPNKLDGQLASRSFRSREEPRPGPLTPPPSKQEKASQGQDLVLDRHMPISIPYTTPASEFLYGASVVRAALTSRRVPRRKHYKLYIYTGENREQGDRDVELERLAARSGVPVVKVSGHWLRVMDKMSGGRPHNGYILEASPLPRLPITSLGPVTTQEGEAGFMLEVDHQSREEALINGSFNFYRTPRTITTTKPRNPFILLLDGIVDPGNLGGIVRTASFLGVTAVAIATGKAASFTPVALKASAGAAENMTLFSVRKPRGFIIDSQAAGWRVYAAVPPITTSDSPSPSSPSSAASPPLKNMPPALSVSDLGDPLAEYPCILMLGSEGEGLRLALRAKADVELSIAGVSGNNAIDSLNVSVATGILCDSFLRPRGGSSSSSPTTSSMNQSSDTANISTKHTEQDEKDLF